MNIRKVPLLAMCILFSQPVLAANKYICTADKSTGFKYEKYSKSWIETSFMADSKYIFSKSKSSKYTYEVTKFGWKAPISLCNQIFSSRGSIACTESLTSDFRFNKNTGRYILVMIGGYFYSNDNTDEKSDTPFIEIGKCLPL